MSGEVLVTGGAGFIGSHTVLQLIQANYTPVIVDNFSNSSPVCIARLENISGNYLINFLISHLIRMSKEVLVTGGAGFIGSHTVIQLLEAGYTPIIVDLFSNSSVVCIQRLERITGTNFC